VENDYAVAMGYDIEVINGPYKGMKGVFIKENKPGILSISFGEISPFAADIPRTDVVFLEAAEASG